MTEQTQSEQSKGPVGFGPVHSSMRDTNSRRAAPLDQQSALLAAGIEPGHGVRNYLIDLSSGTAKAITPEGVSGTQVSPDGKKLP
jgi:hypothetical protein